MQELRSIFRRALIFTLFPVILLTAAPTQATVVEYSGRAAYEASWGTSFLESWDEFSSGTTFGNGSTVNGITYNYIPYIVNTYPARTDVTFQVTSLYAYTTSPNTLGLSPISDPNTGGPDYFTYDGVQFVFSKPIKAFGIDISTFAPSDSTFMATTNQGEVAYSVFDPFSGYSQGQFLGFASDVPFTSVSITYNLTNPNILVDGYAYGWTLDTMRVPLPPSLLLLGSGLAGLGLLRLRKRFQV
jgi:hypothetical protein